MKIFLILSLGLIGFLSRWASADGLCAFYEAQTVLSLSRIETRQGCFYKVKEAKTFIRHSLCPLLEEDLPLFQIFDASCGMKDGAEIRGIVKRNDSWKWFVNDRPMPSVP